MPTFPEVRACLIAELVRAEQYRKLSVLGLYGLTPDVKILCKTLPGTLESVTFLLICEPTKKATHKATVQILSENEEKSLVGPTDLELTVSRRPDRITNLILAFNAVKFENAGNYKLRLTVGEWQYEAKFEIALGQPEDFPE